MRIHYSKEVDVLYIRLKETEIANTDEADNGMILDYDCNGDVVGIEILSASQHAEMNQLVIQLFDNVKVESKAA